MSSFNRQGAARAPVPVSSPIVSAAALVALACLGVAQPARADVLVVAPHPDDDLITSAGVMLRARQAGETVRVMFMTNGDISGMTSGLLRQDEAVTAETLLGVAEGNMIFLGYPDGGLQDLRGPFASASTAMTGNSGLNHTYGDRGVGGMDYHRFAFGASGNNNGANVIADIAHALSTYRPSDIFVTSEFDQHPDHAATYQFVIDGIASARASSPTYNPTVHKTIVWNDFSNTDAWPTPQNPSTYNIEPPSLLSRTGLVWSQRESLDVPLDAQVTVLAQNLKWRAINAHNSQGGAGLGSYIGQFVHKDEWFFTARASGANRPPVPNAGSDQSANAGAGVTLNGSTSFDPDGSALAYQWRQTSGPSVTLSSASAAQPTFTVPASTTTATVFAFELKVSDGTSTSVADGVSVLVNTGGVTPPPPAGGSNLALLATASASTQSGGQEASKVIDGFTDGYPANPAHEWSSNGQAAGAWVQLTWPTAQTINQVVLFDRPNADDRVMSGTLTFSSGASVAVGALDNAGAALTVAVSSRSVTWVRFTVNTVGANTYNVGLAELQVFNTSGGSTPPANQAPVASAGANQTVTQGVAVTLSGAGSSDPEGSALTYAWSQVSGPSVTLTGASTVSPTFTSPSGSTSVQTLVFQLVVNDGTAASSPAQTTVTVNPPSAPPAGGTNLALTATASASTQAGGQEASKVRDGFTDGYPTNASHEWASNGQAAGAWVQLTWPTAQTINQVVLFDRPNADDRVMSGTLTFSSGASVAVGALDNAGAALTVAVSSRSVTWVRFTVNTVSANTYNVGLAELQVFNTSGGSTPPANQAPVASAGANQAVAQGVAVSLSGAGSSDPEGSTLTYAWTQVSGPSVTLAAANTVGPTFTSPSGSTSVQTLVFQLIVNDGTAASSPAQTTVTVNPPSAPPPPSNTNLALTATASASTQASGQEASKVRDTFTDGYPTNATHEWSSNGQAVGAWVQLTWPTAQTINQVVLFDRPNADDRVMAGTLTFSSGASVAVGALDNAGAALSVAVSSRSVTWVRFTVNTVSANTYNVGLAELQVFNGSGTVNQSPVANAGANQTVAQGATVTLSGSGSDPEGAPITYDWAQTMGPAVLTVDNVANPTFVAPSGATSNVTLTFELVVSDGVYSSAPATTTVTVLAPSAPPPPPVGGTNLALTATATASTQASGQEASKVRDGFTDGYPTDFSHEWSSVGQGAGAWVQLTWPSAQSVSSVTLFDRPNTDDNVLSGTLTFSNGSSVAVGALTNSGAGVTVSFAARSVTWVRFTVNSVSGVTYNVGLAELEVR